MWQSEWDSTTKGTITKLYFPKIADRLKLKINVTPNFTTMVTGRGNIKSYLYKYKIIDSPMCPCKNGEQTTDRIQGYSKVPPGFPNSTAQQPRQTRQKGAYQ